MRIWELPSAGGSILDLATYYPDRPLQLLANNRNKTLQMSGRKCLYCGICGVADAWKRAKKATAVPEHSA